MSENNNKPLKLGTIVKILNSGFPRAEIVEYRGPLGRGGTRIYGVIAGHETYLEVGEEQIEVLEHGTREPFYIGLPIGPHPSQPTKPTKAKAMPTVKLVDENDPNPIIQRVFADIKATKKIDFIPAIWRALATHPEHLELCWTRLKAIMQPGKVDLLTKEIIALAVSVTNSCRYCINSHTAAAQKLGLDDEMLGEVLAVVGLFNQMNKLADGYQIEPDILPAAARSS